MRIGIVFHYGWGTVYPMSVFALQACTPLANMETQGGWLKLRLAALASAMAAASVAGVNPPGQLHQAIRVRLRWRRLGCARAER